MKKIVSFILAIALCMLFSSCDESQSSYTADVDFFYSVDNGQTFKSNSVMFNVGQNVLMKTEISVEASEVKQKNIHAILTLPKTETVEISYMGGPTVSPAIDPVTGAVSYDFSILASGNISVVFALLANEEAEISMSLKFDDNIDPAYDKIETICFVGN